MDRLTIINGRVVVDYQEGPDHRGDESIKAAKEVFRLARYARRNNKGMSWISDNKICKYNRERGDGSFWNIYRITSRGSVRIGCKLITWKQMLPIAKKLGFRKLD